MGRIELQKRVLPTKIARLMAQKVYGRVISDEAWKNWKLWSGCPGRKLWMDTDQVTSILAIAAIRSGNQFGELSREDINSFRVLANQKLKAMIDEMDQGLIFGKDIPKFVESYSRQKVSPSLLYRKIPKFSAKGIYEKRLVLEKFAA